MLIPLINNTLKIQREKEPDRNLRDKIENGQRYI